MEHLKKIVVAEAYELSRVDSDPRWDDLPDRTQSLIAETVGQSQSISFLGDLFRGRWKLKPEEVEPSRHLLYFEGQEGGWEPGGFSKKMIEALSRADNNNQTRLLRAFPEYIFPFMVMQNAGSKKLAELVKETEK